MKAIISIGVAVLLAGVVIKAQQGDPPARRDAGGAVTVRVIDGEGKLTGPIETHMVMKSDAEWKRLLSPQQYHVIREAGTERAGTGELLGEKSSGVFTCAACDLPLFSSKAKFESGTGWPSFFEAIAKENVGEHTDRSHGMVRTEIVCTRCDGHLGHVFTDGPQPTGLRYCVNSLSLDFTPTSELESLADPVAEKGSMSKKHAEMVIAGGCFWCVEAVFEELEGVIEAESGYCGGTKETANYQEVCSGQTKHAEAVRITYDPERISYVDLLLVHFATHDPTQLNRQGNDIGPQYRSAIFYADDAELAKAKAVMDAIDEQGTYRKKVVTTLEPLSEFYVAEQYHQNYVCDNPTQGYVRGVALPKVEKVRKLFKDRLKATSPLDR